MTDEGQGTPEPPEVAPAASAEAAAATSGTSGENMVMMGGGLVIASYLVFGLILNEYWVGWVPLLFAIVAVLLPRLDQGFIAKFAPVPTVTRAVGFLLAIIGAVAVLEDIRFASSAIDSFVEILGAVIAYAGYAASFLGARSIKA